MWPTKMKRIQWPKLWKFSSLSDSPPGCVSRLPVPWSNLFLRWSILDALSCNFRRFVGPFFLGNGRAKAHPTKTWAFRAFDAPNDDQQLQLSSCYEGENVRKCWLNVHWNFSNQSIGLPIWAESNTIAIVFDQWVASLERHRCTLSSPLAELQDPSCCFLMPSQNL